MGVCKEKVLVEMIRFGGFLGSNVEIKYNGNFLEFIRLILVKIFSFGGWEVCIRYYL